MALIHGAAHLGVEAEPEEGRPELVVLRRLCVT
jgi:hypothetical protein